MSTNGRNTYKSSTEHGFEPRFVVPQNNALITSPHMFPDPQESTVPVMDWRHLWVVDVPPPGSLLYEEEVSSADSATKPSTQDRTRCAHGLCLTGSGPGAEERCQDDNKYDVQRGRWIRGQRKEAHV